MCAVEVTWLVLVSILTAAIGSIAEQMGNALADNPVLSALLGADAEKLPLTMGMVWVAVTAGCYVLNGRIAAEERRGGLSLVVALGRRRVWLSWWLLVVVPA